jgi:inhibitor of KinA
MGDSALRVEFDDRIDPVVNQAVITLAQAISAAGLGGVRDVVPTYRSVAVYFDPLRTDYDALVARVTREASAATPALAAPVDPIRVPVCYEGDYAVDLAAVAAFAGVTEAEVVRLHLSRTYRVFMLGFVPGFAYMGTVDDRIAMPRLPVPRVRVPAGAVGIAGGQTGVYPATTPGGWRIVGRTPVKPFDQRRAAPFLFKPGDGVQFYAIDRAEFSRLGTQGSW